MGAVCPCLKKKQEVAPEEGEGEGEDATAAGGDEEEPTTAAAYPTTTVTYAEPEVTTPEPAHQDEQKHKKRKHKHKADDGDTPVPEHDSPHDETQPHARKERAHSKAGKEGHKAERKHSKLAAASRTKGLRIESPLIQEMK